MLSAILRTIFHKIEYRICWPKQTRVCLGEVLIRRLSRSRSLSSMRQQLKVIGSLIVGTGLGCQGCVQHDDYNSGAESGACA